MRSPRGWKSCVSARWGLALLFMLYLYSGVFTVLKKGNRDPYEQREDKI